MWFVYLLSIFDLLQYYWHGNIPTLILLFICYCLPACRLKKKLVSTLLTKENKDDWVLYACVCAIQKAAGDTLWKKMESFKKPCVVVLNCGFFIWPEGGPSNDLDDMLYGLLDINGETDWFCIKGRRETPTTYYPWKKAVWKIIIITTQRAVLKLTIQLAFFVSPTSFFKRGLEFSG